jgi:hypothetical protein
VLALALGASGKPPSPPAPAPTVAMVDILVAKIDIEIGRRVTRAQSAAGRARFRADRLLGGIDGNSAQAGTPPNAQGGKDYF